MKHFDLEVTESCYNIAELNYGCITKYNSDALSKIKAWILDMTDGELSVNMLKVDIFDTKSHIIESEHFRVYFSPTFKRVTVSKITTEFNIVENTGK